MIRGIFEAHSPLIATVFFPLYFLLFNKTILDASRSIQLEEEKEGRKKKPEFSAWHSGVLKTGTFRWFNADSVVHPHVRGWDDVAISVLLRYFLLPGARRKDSEEKKAKREEKLKREGNHSR